MAFAEDQTLPAALFDRLLHHSHIVQIAGGELKPTLTRTQSKITKTQTGLSFLPGFMHSFGSSDARTKVLLLLQKSSCEILTAKFWRAMKSRRVKPLGKMPTSEEQAWWSCIVWKFIREDGEAAKSHLAAGYPIYYCDDRLSDEVVRE